MSVGIGFCKLFAFNWQSNSPIKPNGQKIVLLKKHPYEATPTRMYHRIFLR